ncbi:MAG: IPTL-CTERM sorting domain-containing protein, partial [Cocleimonas sp.]
TPAGVVPTAGSTDSDVGTDTSGENNKTHNGAGTTVTVETTDNLTLDFGFVPSVKIGSLIWYEDDNDGDATTGTVTYPPAGVVVTARAADGSIYTGITGANGSYSIDVPINGTYTVTIPPPTGFSPTAGSGDNGVPSDNSEDNKSHNGSGTTVTVGTTDNLTVDFGFINNSLLPPPSNEPIPTLSEWALLLLMMILGLIGYRQGLVRKS